MTDRIPELPTDRYYFLELSETCLYMVHFGQGPFFGNRKNRLHRFTIESNQNTERNQWAFHKLWSGISTY